MESKREFLASWAPLAVAFAVPTVMYKIFNYIYNRNKMGALKEKVVLITGASSGIGEALAHEFYQQGCKVILCARRQNELERVRTDILRKYPKLTIHPPVVMPLDLSNLETIDDTVAKILDITQHVDVLINNGGISNRGSVVETQNDVFLKVMMVNYFGTVALTKAILPHMMKRQEGHVVFMSSIQGLFAIPYRSAYAASKHAIKAFSDSLRAEVASYNISVTCINPGYVKTSMSRNALTATGEAHAKMDPATEQGYSPEYIAKKTSLALVCKQNEVTLAPLVHKLVILVRTNIPNLYFYIMKLRANSQKA